MANLKSIKKGDKVILRMFTGAFVEAKTVEMADAKKIGFTNKKGIKMVFDKVTGKQLQPEPKNERFANYLDEYDEKVEAEALAKREKGRKKAEEPKKTTSKKEKLAKKASTKKAAVDPEDEIEDEEEE